MGEVQLVEGLDTLIKDASNRIQGALELLTQLVLEGGLIHVFCQLPTQGVYYGLVLGHSDLVVVELVVDKSELLLVGLDLDLHLLGVVAQTLEVLSVSFEFILIDHGILLSRHFQCLVSVIQILVFFVNGLPLTLQLLSEYLEVENLILES